MDLTNTTPFLLKYNEHWFKKNLTQSTGFEPVRAEPNGFLVHRLNHSATTAFGYVAHIFFFIYDGETTC